MMAYLIETGNHYIIYVKELKGYFFVEDDASYLSDFISDKPDFSIWKNKYNFKYELGQTKFTDNTQEVAKKLVLGKNISEDEVLEKFYNPAHNPGAVIAVRDSTSSEVVINDKHRFKKILKQFFLDKKD